MGDSDGRFAVDWVDSQLPSMGRRDSLGRPSVLGRYTHSTSFEPRTVHGSEPTNLLILDARSAAELGRQRLRARHDAGDVGVHAVDRIAALPAALFRIGLTDILVHPVLRTRLFLLSLLNRCA